MVSLAAGGLYWSLGCPPQLQPSVGWGATRASKSNKCLVRTGTQGLDGEGGLGA